MRNGESASRHRLGSEEPGVESSGVGSSVGRAAAPLGDVCHEYRGDRRRDGMGDSRPNPASDRAIMSSDLASISSDLAWMALSSSAIASSSSCSSRLRCSAGGGDTYAGDLGIGCLGVDQL